MEKKQQPDDGATTKTFLQQSVIHYLHLNGFSKTLKRFLKETKTEGDSWKSYSLNLEDMYYKYLNCSDNDPNSKGNGESEQCEDGTNGKNTIKNASDSLETISKKKKKKRSEDKNNVSDAFHPADMSLKKQKEKKKKKTAHDIVEENWVSCAECKKWRLLPYGREVPGKWVCNMQTWLPRMMNHCGTSVEETTKAVRGLSQDDYMANAGKKKHKSRDTEPLMVQF